MKQIEPGHIVIFTVDLAVDHPDYHLRQVALTTAAVEVSAEHLSPLIARAQVQMAVNPSFIVSIVPVSDTISKLPLKSFA